MANHSLFLFASSTVILVLLQTLLFSSSSSTSFTVNAQTCLQDGASPITLEASVSDFGPVPRGYYALNLSKNSNVIYICPPTAECLQKRITGEEFCEPQGSNDVAICPPGSYCPTFNSKLRCPAGSYCPTGSTEPISCSPMSYCPEGASREVFYGSLFILFFLLMIYALAMNMSVLKVGAVPASWNEDTTTTSTSSPDAISTTTPRKDQRKLEMAEDGSGAFAASPSMIPSQSMVTKATESMKVIGNAIKRRRDVQTQSRKTAKGKLEQIKGKERLTINFNDLSVSVPVDAEEIAQNKREAELQKTRDEEMMTNADKNNNNNNNNKQNESGGQISELAQSPSFQSATAKKQRQDKSWHTFNDKGEKILLHPMSGSIESAKLTCILAPASAGKSILIKRLLGRKDPAWNTSGFVTTTTIFDEEISAEDQQQVKLPSAGSTAITSRPLSDEEFRDLTALVPQESVLHHDLTIHQNLFFTSETRLPTSWTVEEKQEFRKAILQALQLFPLADTIVGRPADEDESAAGSISGGQRKRCSIGVELSSAPIFLAGDSISQGLDASVAHRLCELLKRLAVEAEIPILLVLDQPRIEIFELLDNLFLLAPGGRMCYSGEAANAIEFIRDFGLRDVPNHGFDFSSGNPADLIVDVIAIYPDEIVEAWNLHGKAFNRMMLQRKIQGGNYYNNNNKVKNINDRSPDAIVANNDSDHDNDGAVIPSEKQHTEQALEPMNVEQLQIVKNRKARQQQIEDDLHREADELRQPSTKQFEAARNDNQQQIRENQGNHDGESSNQKQQHQQQQQQKQVDDEFIVTKDPTNEKPGVLHEAWYMFLRRFVKFGSEWKVFVNDIIMTVVCSAIMSASVVGISWGAPLKGQYVLLGAKFQNELIFMYGMLLCIGTAAAIGPTAIRVWALEKNQLLREFRGGNRVTSVYLGYTLAENCRLFLLSYVFALVGYLMWQPVMKFGDFLGIVFSIFLCQDAVGAWIGIIVPLGSARLIALIGTVFMSLLNAFPDVPIVFHGFYAYYQTILLTAAEWEPSKHVYDMEAMTSDKAFKSYPDDPIAKRGLAIAIILIWYFGLKIGAFLHLVYLSKQSN